MGECRGKQKGKKDDGNEESKEGGSKDSSPLSNKLSS